MRYEAYREVAHMLKYYQRTRLPDCAVALIRQAWPEPSGMYTGFIPGCADACVVQVCAAYDRPAKSCLSQGLRRCGQSSCEPLTEWSSVRITTAVELGS